MKLTPQREALMWEAKQLREFGYTQQMIADELKVPLATVNRWFISMGMGKADDTGNSSSKSHIAMPECSHIQTSVILYPKKYEDGELPPDTQKPGNGWLMSV